MLSEYLDLPIIKLSFYFVSIALIFEVSVSHGDLHAVTGSSDDQGAKI